MEIFIALLIFLVGLFLYFHYKSKHFSDHMTNEERANYEKFLEEERRSQAESQAVLQRLVVYRTLRDSIHDGMTLDEMIDAFAEMCKISVGDPDDLLFETGTYNFTGQKLFHFNLVRQFQFMDEDEYVQLHLDVLYTTSLLTAPLHNIEWDSTIEADFFDMIRSSRDYRVVKNMPIAKVNVFIEET